MGTPDSGSLGIPESCLDLSFGFDDAKYSDRTLLLQIVDHAKSDDDNPSQLVRNVKPRRDLLITAPTEPRVKTIHISSLILAAMSSFFRKLFSNGMLESEQKNVTIHIQTSEEVPMMDLLKYVYSNNLPTTLNALLNLLVIADKYEVPSCLRDATRALLNLPMTCESASLYLELPPTLLISPQLQPLADAAKHFLVAKFKDLDKITEEVLNLPLPAIQTLLSSDELEVTSECVVYDFVLKWVRKHYPDLEERRGILKTHLLHLIRFPFMTITKLTEEVQTCIDIDCEIASKIVIRALAFKAETPHRKRCLAAEEGNAASQQFVERAYKHRPINVIELALPYQQCIVHLHFKRENLIHLSPEGQVMSEAFHLGEQKFVLFGRFSVTPSKVQNFVLGLTWLDPRQTIAFVNCEVQLKMKPSEEFTSWVKGNYYFHRRHLRSNYLKNVVWTEFIGGKSNYFINNFLHVRLVLTKKWG